MSRLTGRDIHDNVYLKPIYGAYIGNTMAETNTIKSAYNRLAAIEDILCPDNAPEITLDELREMCKAKREGRCVVLPCKVGDTVYRICPKCNPLHDGSCENCAWKNCINYTGCTVFGLWDDGQFSADKCTIVPYQVSWNNIPTIKKEWNKKVFATRPEAEAALAALKEGEKQ